MSETAQGNQEESFEIGQDVQSTGTVSFKGGIHKAELVSVKAHEIGKGEKFFVLDFKFQSLDKIRTFIHREFIPKGKSNPKETEKENYDKRKGWFNSRIKHIYETYVQPFPGLGKGITSWNAMFEAIADAFNKGNGGSPIYFEKKGDQLITIPVFIKVTYSNRNEIQFPQLPEFIEKITPETNSTGNPKRVQINPKFDVIAPVANPTKKAGNVMGGDDAQGNPINNDDLGGF